MHNDDNDGLRRSLLNATPDVTEHFVRRYLRCRSLSTHVCIHWSTRLTKTMMMDRRLRTRIAAWWAQLKTQSLKSFLITLTTLFDISFWKSHWALSQFVFRLIKQRNSVFGTRFYQWNSIDRAVKMCHVVISKRSFSLWFGNWFSLIAYQQQRSVRCWLSRCVNKIVYFLILSSHSWSSSDKPTDKEVECNWGKLRSDLSRSENF